MCTIIMTGKNKKISVSINKTNLMKLLIFTNEEERKRCSKYLDLKGVAFHALLINALGLNEKGKIEYKLVADVYKYDKELRNRLYKFIASFEEQLRAFIANSYSNGLEALKLGEKINYNLNIGNNIANELENLDFKQLLTIINNFNVKILNRMFPDYKNKQQIIQNLKAVKELRNAISHHRIILLYNDYKDCYINGIKQNDLSSNIQNLVNLIDEYYKGYLIDSINNAIINDDGTNLAVPEHLIIKLDVNQ